VSTDRDFNGRDWSLHPAYVHAPYKSTLTRGPTKPLVSFEQTLSERTGPIYGAEAMLPLDADLTKNAASRGEPKGERIIVTGRVLDESGTPIRDALVEVWQANAAGRYAHKVDQHDAPLDPNFLGAGRSVTDGEGRYTFTTIKPGAYPWKNHPNAWRPAHIHFSLFGPSLLTRLVTQMYFPGDPLLPLDPIFNGVPDDEARGRLVSKLSMDVTKEDWALGYVFDIVLRGPKQTPMER
jgi:protocatechuate 3,4-dioxygenase beta subunit